MIVKKKKEYTDEEDYVYCLMGWLVANADDDLTQKYLNHRNRRSFKFSLEKISDHLEKTGWYNYTGSKYFTEDVGRPEDLRTLNEKRASVQQGRKTVRLTSTQMEISKRLGVTQQQYEEYEDTK